MTNSSDIPLKMNQTDGLFTWLIVETAKDIKNASAAGDVEKEFEYFKWMMRFLINHMPIEDKKGIEEDYTHMMKKIYEIEDDSNINTSSKEILIKKIKRIFIDTHASYVLLAFPRAGVNKVLDDNAIINFDKIDFDTIKKIVRLRSINKASEVYRNNLGTEVENLDEPTEAADRDDIQRAEPQE